MKLKKLVLRAVGVALFAMLLFAAGSAIAQQQQREAATPRISTGAAQLLLAQAGHSAGTEGGAGAAGQTGTPPAELSRDQVRREQAGRAKPPPRTPDPHAAGKGERPAMPQGASDAR
ncbi:hypothetical protein LJ656_23270 [Paraburkholderia sp. MMS20-SJTR3]|uniref:Uncharacterized protein n=1 Tax=Paraburkholderia sejongensis TaxID=2886946 RepID=A0ABS8K013_9BURK|nr:hypothetical protein [Paraburkholderia sp. MMS20-SJTR3]MCC8395511.1 hypothetical protein [Paraburkholderia sp. MMS20-SJTR3]